MGKISYWSIRSDFSSNDHVAAHIFHIFPFRGSFPDFSYFRLSNDLRHFSYNIVVVVFFVCGRYWMFSVDINACFFSFFLSLVIVFFPLPKNIGYCEICMLPDFVIPGVMLIQTHRIHPPPSALTKMWGFSSRLLCIALFWPIFLFNIKY